MPLVSVIIPCYNPNAYLTDAINSVLKQSLQDFEIAVIDDGSTVDVSTFLPTDSRIKYVRREHDGVAISRNVGFSVTTGDYIAFLDADDLWHENKLALQTKMMQADPDMALCYTNVATLDQRSGRSGAPVVAPGDSHVDFSRSAFEIMDQCNICTSTVMIRREALNICGWFDPLLSFSEDYDLFLRIGRFFRRLGYVSTAEVSYRIWDSNVSARYKQAYQFGCQTLRRHHRFGSYIKDSELSRVADGLSDRLSLFCAARAYDNCRARLKNREIIGFAQEFISALFLNPQVVYEGLSSWVGKRLPRVSQSD